MKPITILKKLITLFYYITGIGLVSEVFSLIYRFFIPKMVHPRFLQGEELFSSDDIKVMGTRILFTLLIFAFFRAIEMMTYQLNDLSDGKHFSEKVTKRFKGIGKLFIIMGIGEFLAKICTNYIFGLGLTFPVDSSIVLFPVVGLFFIYLGEVFTEAREIQQENNLTI